MRRATALLAVALVGVGPAAVSVARNATTGNAPTARAASPVAGIPDGAPAAAFQTEPVLPAPHGWPFGETWSRTSGTGRLGGGATFWSDFLYDDHGAANVPVSPPAALQGSPTSSLAPTDGTYTYPAGAAHANGADIFRAAVGLDGDASYWRVDWVTLASPDVPIAEWTVDGDASTTTGVSTWAAGAGVRSPGIDHALVVSSKSARLIDLVTGRSTVLPVDVDTTAKSFIVRVPRSMLPVSGVSRLRLASGLAAADAATFAPVTASLGAGPGQPPIYNVTFRTVSQEPPQYEHGLPSNTTTAGAATRLIDNGNFWLEDHQAQALAAGDVSPFSLDVNWSRLAGHVATPDPLVTGYSNRWYVSTISLGDGVVQNTGNNTGDLLPNYLGRLQPYAVYVPTNYDPGTAAPLTWVLHSLSVNLNQYGALDPRLLQQLCEDRHSVCATTEGRGPDGWYFDEAEVDFWQVWHQLALTYRLDPERTAITGYSMGGFAAYKLGLEYPDLFAGAMALAGPPTCGLRVFGDARGAGGPGRCTTDGDTQPLVGNALWVPYVLADGVADQLVPFTSVLEQQHQFIRWGLRYHAEIYPAEDHLYYATQDAFDTAVAALGTPVRVVNPGRVHFTWYPNLVRSDYGIGPTGDYWVRNPVARSAAAGGLASIEATDQAIPMPGHNVVVQRSLDVPGNPSPAVVLDHTWVLTPAPPLRDSLSMTLTNVGSLAIDIARAQLSNGGSAMISTDGPTVLTLLGVPAHSALYGSHFRAYSSAGGRVVVQLPKGVSSLRWSVSRG